MPHTPEVLADLVARLRRAPRPPEGGPPTASDRVYVLDVEEFKSAYYGRVLELDRAATFQLCGAGEVLPAADPRGAD